MNSAARRCQGDRSVTTTVEATLATASANLDAAGEDDIGAFLALPVLPASELVADKGYHSNDCLKHLDSELVRTYISEPERGRRNWAAKELERDLVYANRRRIRGKRGKRLFRLRAELCEREFAHLFTTGGMRRTYLRGHENILKRLLIHTCGFNLGLVMRKLFGKGTPKGLHGHSIEYLNRFLTYIAYLLCSTAPAANGTEFAEHGELSEAWSAKVFFAHPYSSWERGVNENTNGLLRQYFPKGMDLRGVSKERIAEVENLLNNRPRKRFAYRTPAEEMARLTRRSRGVRFRV